MRGLGQSSGFELWLQDAENKGRDALLAAQNTVLKAASADSGLAAVRLNSLEDKAQLQVDIDQRKASALGLAQADISNTLSSAWGGSYINDLSTKVVLSEFICKETRFIVPYLKILGNGMFAVRQVR